MKITFFHVFFAQNRKLMRELICSFIVHDLNIKHNHLLSHKIFEKHFFSVALQIKLIIYIALGPTPALLQGHY